MNEIKEMLSEKIKTGIQNLSEFEDGSEERVKAVDDVVKLHKLRMEEIKAEAEIEESRKNRKDSKFNTFINVGLQAITFVGGIIAYDVWHRRGLKFEETGTITSPQTRNLISRMLPGKK